MINLKSSVFSLSECDEIKNLLKNPEDDFHRIISLLENKVEEKTSEISASEEQYRSLMTVLTNVGFGIDIVDKDFKILYQNQVLKDNFGDSIGEICYERYMGKNYRCSFCQMEETLEKNKIAKQELKAVDKRFYEIISAPYPNTDGTIEKVLEIIIDITDKKKVEQKLRESEEKYRILTEQSLLGIFIIQEGKLKYINQAVSEMIGYSVEEMLNWNGFDIAKTIYSEDLETIMTRLKRSEEGDLDDQSSSVFRLYTKDGNIKWIEEYNKKIEFQGKPASMVTLIDITSKVESEKELKKTEERLRSLIENTTDAVFCYEFSSPIAIELPVEEQVRRMYDAILVDCNLRCAKSYGTDRVEDVIGRNFTDLFGTTPKSLDNLFRELIKGGYRIIDGIGVEKLPNGKERYFLNNGYGVIENGKILRIWGTFRDITDQKLIEQKMLESERKYRHLFYRLPLSISIFDSKGNLIESNRVILKKLSEYAELDFIGKNYLEIIPYFQNSEDLLRLFKERLYEMRRGNNPGPIELYLITNKGKKVWLYWSSSRIEINNEICFQVVIQDITEQKQAEEKLRESEEKFRTITEQSFMGIFILQDGKFKYANQTLSDITGYTLEKIFKWTQNNVLSKIHPEDLSNIAKTYQMNLKGDPIDEKTSQFRFKHNSGSYIWLETFSKRIEYENRAATLTSIINITDKKHSEQKLKESEQKFRKITEESLLSICIIQDNLIKYVNQEMASLYGYSVNEMLNWKPGELLKVVAPESLETVKEQLRKKQEGDPDVIIHYPIQCIKKNGEQFWVDNISKSMVYNGRPADLVTQIDITERIRAQKELVKLNQMKSELLRRTSHELKTPLVSIKGFSDLLLKIHRDKLDANVISALNEIKQGCLRLENLIGDILKTAELESGATELVKSEENLTFLVDICINELKGFLKLRNHKINLDLHEKLITLFEKEQIHQVISNLLTNAVKYTPPSGVIEIKSRISDDFIMLSIKDNGIGFTEEEKSRIFKQFGKIERYGQGLDIIPEGSGFGLFISKKIIELHGGDLWLESEGRNRGSTFHFSLPIIQN